jgi:hypothetical protein
VGGTVGNIALQTAACFAKVDWQISIKSNQSDQHQEQPIRSASRATKPAYSGAAGTCDGQQQGNDTEIGSVTKQQIA